MKTKTAAKHTPILKGDNFIDSKGRLWEVFETNPGGVVELFCKERSLFNRTYTRCIREWIAAGTFKRAAIAKAEAK